MADTYTTKQGDVWDMISYAVYGSELHVGWLMQNNMRLLDMFVFSSGVVLQTPPLPESAQLSQFPPWRSET